MARIIYELIGDTEWRGPYPNKDGEHCGNISRRSIVILPGNKAKLLIPAASLCLPPGCENAVFRVGKPSVKGNTISLRQELEKHAFVGLYLAEDLPQIAAEQDVDTDMFLEEVVSGERVSQKPFCLHRDQGL